MIDDVLKDLRDSIAKAHDALKRDLSKVRTGRAAASMLDSVRVDYYGTMTPLAQLGFNPQSDGDQIRVPVPPLTEDRRKDMTKVARKHGEECKVTIRGARRDALELLSSATDDGDVSEDEGDRAKKKAEELIVDATKQVDTIVSTKEKEILDV